MRGRIFLSQARSASGANAVLGVWLAMSPLLFEEQHGGTSTWSDVMTGAFIAALAIPRSLGKPDSLALGWANVFLGGWAALLPWSLDFLDDPPRAWNSAIVGLAVIFFGIWGIHTTTVHRTQRQQS